MRRLRLITLVEASSISPGWCDGVLALRSRLPVSGEDRGDWTVSSPFVEHSGYAGSTIGPCTISLQPPG